jgi:hypothetical protein
MHPFADRPTTSPFVASFSSVPSVDDGAPPATQGRSALGWRNQLFLGSLLAVPAAAGIAVARATSRGRGILAGGLAALALGALRVELARWFTPEPAFAVEATIANLELRRYPARIEAVATVGDIALEAALDHGYSRLASYCYGANYRGELLKRTMPILTAMQDGRYSVAFVMPPGLALQELPRPSHPGVELRQVPARRLAVLRFRGRFTRDNIAAHERILLAQLVDAGLSARGSVTFAAFDTPATLPLLRRNELWIEIV